MKKYFSMIIILSVLIFSLPFLSCQAGLLASSSGLTSQTDVLRDSAGFDANTNVADVVATIIDVALGLLGIIFLVLLVMSGYQWMTAGGNEEQVEKAKSRIKTAIIGLIIVLAAYAITAFVFQNLPFSGGGTTTAGQGN